MAELNKSTPRSETNVSLKVVWLAFDDVDAPVLRHNLRRAILQAEHRVRLDCREVDGAPRELIDILQEANEFAKCSGKQVTLAFASDHLRHALTQTNGRKLPTQTANHGPGSISAAMAAENSLKHRTDSRHDSIEPKLLGNPLTLHASSLPRAAKLRQWFRRRLAMLLAIAIGGSVVIGIEWYFLPFEAETFVVEQMGGAVEQPIKTFEGGPAPGQ